MSLAVAVAAVVAVAVGQLSVCNAYSVDLPSLHDPLATARLPAPVADTFHSVPPNFSDSNCDTSSG